MSLAAGCVEQIPPVIEDLELSSVLTPSEAYASVSAADGSFRLVYLGDGRTDFQLELTWLRDREAPYDLGECEFHLAFVTDQYQAFYEKHQAMGCVCFENPAMGIYFISDPDGYWIEIVPEKK